MMSPRYGAFTASFSSSVSARIPSDTKKTRRSAGGRNVFGVCATKDISVYDHRRGTRETCWMPSTTGEIK